MRRCDTAAAHDSTTAPTRSHPRPARPKRGAAVLEFALVMPVLTLILFGIITYGSVFYTLNSMKESAQDAARRMAVGAVTFSGTTMNCSAAASGSAEAVACRDLPRWATYRVRATQDCGTMDDTVTLTTAASSAALADVFGLMRSGDLTVTSIMRKEGKCP